MAGGGNKRGELLAGHGMSRDGERLDSDLAHRTFPVVGKAIRIFAPHQEGVAAELKHDSPSSRLRGRMRCVNDVRASLEVYRGMREELEAAILPLATSVDGRGFHFQTSLHGLEFQPGGYVTLDARGSTQLGQLLSLDLTHVDATGPGMPGQIRIRVGEGEGVVLDGDGRPFHDASVRRATSDDVRDWIDRTKPDRARLEVGELALAPGVPFALDAGGFGRHTFSAASPARARPIRSACCSST